MTHDESCAALERVYLQAAKERCEPSWFHLGVVLGTGSFSESVKSALALLIERRVLLTRSARFGSGKWDWYLEVPQARKLHMGVGFHPSVFMLLVYVSRRLEECGKPWVEK